MDATHALALTAGGLNILAFILYNKDAFTGSTRPNAATWFLWALVTIVNAASYHGMGVDWATLVVMVSDTSLCTITFLFLLVTGKFGRLNRSSWIIVMLSTAAIALWVTSSAEGGNILAQIPMVLSFIPILSDIRIGKTIENPWVWVLFTASFVINLLLVYLTWSGRFTDFVYPIVAVVMHGAVLYYAFRGVRLYKNKMK